MAKPTSAEAIDSAIQAIDEEIEALRRARETLLRMRGKPSGEASAGGAVGSPVALQAGEDPLAVVHEQEFSGMAATQAARVFLQRIGRNDKTPVILAAIEKGGVQVGGATPALKAARIYTAMKRHSAFVALGKNYWDLAERRPDLAHEKKQRGGARRKGGRKKPGPKPGSGRIKKVVRIAPEAAEAKAASG